MGFAGAVDAGAAGAGAGFCWAIVPEAKATNVRTATKRTNFFIKDTSYLGFLEPDRLDSKINAKKYN